MRLRLILVGLLLLLAGSYLDNIRGILIPVLTREFSVPYAYTSWFLVGGNLSAVVVNSALIWIARAYSIRTILLWLSSFAIVFAAISQYATTFPRVIFLAVYLGMLVAAFGSMANVMVTRGSSVVQRARALCALHVMYGIGSLTAPGFGGFLLGNGSPWYSLLQLSVVFSIAVMGITFRYLWNEREQGRTSPDFGPLAPGSWIVVLAFMFYVPGEVVTSSWLATYLVEVRQITPAEAAPYVTGFFAVLAATRAVTFFVLKYHQREKELLVGSLALGALFFLIGRLGWDPAFALCGVLGPFFPLMLARIGGVFPTSSQTLTLTILMSVQGILAVSHLTVGRLTDVIGVQSSYWLPFGFLLLTFFPLFAFFRFENRIALSRAAQPG